MDTPLAITTATRDGNLIRLTFNNGSSFAIYTDDGSPRNYAHDLLDAWLAAGNEID